MIRGEQHPARRDLGLVDRRHRLGMVMANAGIDRSNVAGEDRVLLLGGACYWGQAAFALAEMGAFVLVLLVGFVYIWKKGGLEWQ